MTPYEEIVHALRRATMSKAEIGKITKIPYGPLGHALEVLTLEGKVLKEGLRYRLKGGSHAQTATRYSSGVWGSTPRPR